MNKNKVSVATIANPEFINLSPLDINPLMSKCEIKVLYIGENRNKTSISKEVATEMSKTLRGAPIVGYYKENNQDFGDHGDKITIEGGQIKFESMTQPYGFVAPDSKVWFQTFVDTDEFGNQEEREYLMTEGYLWTGQYEEAAQIMKDGGKPQSMEIDKKSLSGHWTKNDNSGIEFFIINDAVFSKLCILGDDVEPCFEGADIKAPEVSASFTINDNNFKQTLFTMMNELKFALEGGHIVEDNKEILNEEVVSTESTEEDVVVEDNVETSFSTEKENKEETSKNDDDSKEEEKKDDAEEAKSNYAKEDDKEEEKKEDEEKDSDSNDDTEKKEDEEKEDEKNKYSLLSEQYSALETQYNELLQEVESLREFKLSIDKKEKEDMIKGFYMLSDEDKKDVIENIDKYSLDEIEAKLSIICVRNKVSFTLEEESEETIDKTEDVITYNVKDVESASIPAWVKLVKENQ